MIIKYLEVEKKQREGSTKMKKIFIASCAAFLLAACTNEGAPNTAEPAAEEAVDLTKVTTEISEQDGGIVVSGSAHTVATLGNIYVTSENISLNETVAVNDGKFTSQPFTNNGEPLAKGEYTIQIKIGDLRKTQQYQVQ